MTVVIRLVTALVLNLCSHFIIEKKIKLKGVEEDALLEFVLFRSKLQNWGEGCGTMKNKLQIPVPTA